MRKIPPNENESDKACRARARGSIEEAQYALVADVIPGLDTAIEELDDVSRTAKIKIRLGEIKRQINHLVDELSDRDAALVEKVEALS